VQHKGSFGDVLVLGGAPGMGGAALLAARAALTAGAGRTYIARLDGNCAPDPMRPELMPRLPDEALQPALLQRATVVCGCGGGAAVAATLPQVLDQAARLLLDADALNAVAADAALRALLCTRADRGLSTVLTPHPLEAARLLGSSTAAVQVDRLQQAQALRGRLRRAFSSLRLAGAEHVVKAAAAGPVRRRRVPASVTATVTATVTDLPRLKLESSEPSLELDVPSRT
jgi:NAD(P)H-hydrate repair Nnr-like enzyme with NAD(P)H-hydrate dehydratase domain